MNKIEFKIWQCPLCKSKDVSLHMTAGEIMGAGSDCGEMMFAILPGVPDVLRCNDCKQLFDENGNQWKAEDLEPKIKHKKSPKRHPDADFGIDMFI